MSESDERHMRRALELAGRGRGLTSPNPMVGALVVDTEGVVVGEGFHRQAGAPHAEIEALALAGARAQGATLYVTLEPCVHQGRTPPCVPAVVTAGVKRVVAALNDPNPLVAGRGLAALQHAGIEVTTGVLEGEAASLNRTFLTAMRLGRPHVTLKGAMTLDGKIADVRGMSRWITGVEARRYVHRLRSEVDAIIVGVETVLRDDPALTVRLGEPWPREPWRVVLDSVGRTPAAARLIAAGRPERALIAVGDAAPPAAVERLCASGATVARCSTRSGRVEPAAVLRELFEREVRAVLLEGGGEVHASFLEAGVVDRVVVFIAPALLGGRTAPSIVGGDGRSLEGAVRLDGVQVTRLDEDLLVEAEVRRERREDCRTRVALGARA